MFDIGFAELIIIGVVALLVIGPERLPDAVRTGSAWLNRFRRSFNDIKREVQQELHNDSVMRDLRDSGESLRRETEALKQELTSPARALEDALKNGPDIDLNKGLRSVPDVPLEKEAEDAQKKGPDKNQAAGQATDQATDQARDLSVTRDNPGENARDE